MNSIFRPVVLVFAIMATYAVVIGWMAWALLVRPGVAHLSVEDRLHGEKVTIGIPASLIDLSVRAVSAAELVTWAGERDVPRVGPVLRVLASDIALAPDVVLFEVFDGDDHVRISKAAGALSLEVLNPRSDVKIDLSPESTARILRTIARR